MSVFENSISAIRAAATAAEAEVGRLQNLAVAKQTEDHLLKVVKANRADLEKQTEAAKAEFLVVKRDSEDAKAEAARIVCDARKTAAEIVVAARAEAAGLLATARKKIANAHSQLEIAS